jgi:hypothetical protein
MNCPTEALSGTLPIILAPLVIGQGSAKGEASQTYKGSRRYWKSYREVGKLDDSEVQSNAQYRNGPHSS